MPVIQVKFFNVAIYSNKQGRAVIQDKINFINYSSTDIYSGKLYNYTNYGSK